MLGGGAEQNEMGVGELHRESFGWLRRLCAVTTAAPLSAKSRRGRIPEESRCARDVCMHALLAAEVQSEVGLSWACRHRGTDQHSPSGAIANARSIAK